MMNEKPLLLSSTIFENPSLIDCLHQSSIDFETNQDEEDIKDLLTKLKKYLDDINISSNLLIEIISTILSCVKHFYEASSQFIEEILKNAKKNANYIILAPYLIQQKNNSNFPEYKSFVSSALKEILPQLHNELNLIIFHQQIPILFKKELILNLLLCTDLTEEITFDFIPFLFSTYFISKSEEFKELFQKVLHTSKHRILPQTSKSNDELFEYLSSNDHQFKEISKETYSLFECALNFILNEGEIDITGLSKESILSFIAVVIIFITKFNEDATFSVSLTTNLIFEGINLFQNNCSHVIAISIDVILKNCWIILNSKLLSVDDSFKILELLTQQLLKGQYFANKTTLLSVIFDFSNKIHCGEISSTTVEGFFNKFGADILKYLIQNYTEFSNSPILIKTKLNLELFDSNTMTNLIKNSEDICQAISIIDNLCNSHFNQVIQYSSEMSSFLTSKLDSKIKEEKLEDAALIINFMNQNEYYIDIDDDLDKTQSTEKLRLMINDYEPNEDASIDENITLLLNCKNQEYMDCHIRILFDEMIKDEELLQMYLTFLIYKKRYLTCECRDFISFFYKEYLKYGDKFINIVKNCYEISVFQVNHSPGLFKSSDFSIYSLPISKLGTSIVSKLFESIKKNPNNYQSFFCLKSIANSFPMLFYKREKEIFDIVFPALNNFHLNFEIHLTEKQDEVAKTSYTAFSFLLSTFHLPVIIDHFLKIIFDDITKYTSQQIACFISALDSLYIDSIMRFVILSSYIKMNIFESLAKIVDRENDTKNNFGLWYKKSIFSFIQNTYQILLEINNNNVIIQAKELMSFDNNITQFYDKIINIYFDTKLIIFDNNLNNMQYITFVEKDRKFWLTYDHYKNSQECTNEVIADFINKMGFNQEIMNTYKYDYPSRPNFFTIKMSRYLCMQFELIYVFYFYNNKIPLNPKLYDKLMKAKEKLNEIENNTDDIENVDIKCFVKFDYLSPLLCNNNLLKKIINQIKEPSIHYLLYINIIEKISKYDKAMFLILEFISQIISENYLNNFFCQSELLCNQFDISINLLRYLSNQSHFNKKFIDICGNNLIDIILSPYWRNDVNFLSKTANLFLNLENDLPIRLTHLISFCFISKDEKAILYAINLCSKFDTQQLININSIILKYLDNIFEDEACSLEKFGAILQSISWIIKQRSKSFLRFLDEHVDYFCLLNNIHKRSEMDYISKIFNELAPEHGHSMVQSEVDNNGQIPESIRNTSPIFWDIFEKYSKKIFELIDNNPLLLDKFNFLLRFPELLSFKLRSSYFLKKMQKKKSYNTTNLNIYRSNLLESSFREFQFKSKYEILNNFNITFVGEKGLDASGLTREWFTEL